jgi:aspartate/methionine/tyrosine aminotransferase
MQYVRMPIEKESPEQFGYDRIRFNLTESSLRDRPLSDLGVDPAELSGLLLAYGDHLGHPGLRERIAELSGVAPEEVLVTAGAASALFILHTTLLERGDRVVAMRPNYGTNLETPRAIGADLAPLDLEFETGFRVDFDRLAELATPGTKLISLTCPHNPTGTTMTRGELDRALALAESRGARLLLDETYREMTHGELLPPAASLSERALSVSSFSKTYGIPGIRVGWILCRDRSLRETLLAAKEQIGICGSVVDEELAYRALLRREEWMPEIRARLRAALETVRRWKAADDQFEWVEPSGGVVCFPRLRADRGVDPERFHSILNERYGTFVGPGHWFERPRSYMRVGFGWPTPSELEEGLANLTRAARDAAGA